VDHGALEEASALGVRGVLVQRDDVRAVLGQHAGDGGDDSWLVVARDEQTGGVGLGHGCSLQGLRRFCPVDGGGDESRSPS